MIFASLSCYSGPHIYAAAAGQPEVVSDPEVALLSRDAIYIAIAAIAVAMFLYYYQRWRERTDSCHAIMREIDENKDVLTSSDYRRITYKTRHNTIEISHIRYTNAYLDLDGYQSVVHSGFFTQFEADTQHKLTLLYGRIRTRNELITYRDHFQDMFFLHNDGSKESLDRWYREVERYDIFITKLESQILNSKYSLSKVGDIMKKESKRRL